jgi:hypothetical protein
MRPSQAHDRDGPTSSHRLPKDPTALRTALSAIDNSEAVARPEPPSGDGSGAIAGAVHGVGRSEALRRNLTEGEILDVVVAQSTRVITQPTSTSEWAGSTVRVEQHLLGVAIADRS